MQRYSRNNFLYIANKLTNLLYIAVCFFAIFVFSLVKYAHSSSERGELMQLLSYGVSTINIVLVLLLLLLLLRQYVNAATHVIKRQGLLDLICRRRNRQTSGQLIGGITAQSVCVSDIHRLLICHSARVTTTYSYRYYGNSTRRHSLHL